MTQAQETSALERNDLAATNYLKPGNPAVQPPISRRHSSSNYSYPTTTQPKLPTLVETKNLLNAVLGGLESLAEERIRNRTLSDGAFLDPSFEQQQPQSSASRYKTELCRPFEESGKCKYGEKCQFAHGKHELRHMVRHPKYKTELCRTYHSTALCKYGTRCHFIHELDAATLQKQRQTSVSPVGQKLSTSIPTPVSQAPKQVIPPGNLPLSLSRSSMSSPPHLNSFPMSPISPPAVPNSASYFNYAKTPVPSMDGRYSNIYDAGLVDNRRSPPIDFRTLSQAEDSIFDTSSDSERESSTGSPPGLVGAPPAANPSQQYQRLPIFRCLSQTKA